MECINVIEKILKKEYYYNLANVNILIDSNDGKIDKLFQILKKNYVVLKHQFKQLNIGCYTWNSELQNGKYHVLKWNSAIDVKFLNQQHKISVDHSGDVNVKSMKEKFQELKNQWNSRLQLYW